MSMEMTYSLNHLQLMLSKVDLWERLELHLIRIWIGTQKKSLYIRIEGTLRIPHLTLLYTISFCCIFCCILCVIFIELLYDFGICSGRRVNLYLLSKIFKIKKNWIFTFSCFFQNLAFPNFYLWMFFPNFSCFIQNLSFPHFSTRKWPYFPFPTRIKTNLW